MDDMINRHDSIAEEKYRTEWSSGTNDFEEWSSEVLTVQTMFSRMIRKTVPTKAVRNV